MRKLGVASLVVGLTCAFSVAALPVQSALAACAFDCAGNPTVTVAAGSNSVTLGSSATKLTATATLTGGSSETGTIIFTLLYGGSTVDTELATVSGDGTYPTPTGYVLPTTGTVSGTYQWNVFYTGDGTNSAAADQSDPAGQVAVNAAIPALTSSPTPASLGLNSTATVLQDIASLSGAYNPTGSITFTLYQGSSLLDTETVAVNGDGSYATPTGYSLPATPGTPAHTSGTRRIPATATTTLSLTPTTGPRTCRRCARLRRPAQRVPSATPAGRWPGPCRPALPR